MTLYQDPLGLGKHSSESVQLSPQLSPQLLLEGVLSGSRHRPQRDPRGALPDSPHLGPSPQPCSRPWMPPTSRTATTLLRLQPSFPRCPTPGSTFPLMTGLGTPILFQGKVPSHLKCVVWLHGLNRTITVHQTLRSKKVHNHPPPIPAALLIQSQKTPRRRPQPPAQGVSHAVPILLVLFPPGSGEEKIGQMFPPPLSLAPKFLGRSA